MIQQDFAQRHVIFPESLLDSILPDVRYANPVLRANYPTEWQAKQTRQWLAPAGLPLAPSGGGPPPTAPQQQKATNKPGGAVWTDERHPQIAAMMAPYIAKLGDNVFVGELLDAAHKRLADLPIPTGTRFAAKDGSKSYLCWNAVLGRCKFGKGCKFRRNHPGTNELSDEFAAQVVEMLTPAVTHVVATKEAPAKKIKVETGAPARE
jgi:hypothetical protein